MTEPTDTSDFPGPARPHVLLRTLHVAPTREPLRCQCEPRRCRGLKSPHHRIRRRRERVGNSGNGAPLQSLCLCMGFVCIITACCLVLCGCLPLEGIRERGPGNRALERRRLKLEERMNDVWMNVSWMKWGCNEGGGNS